jgi:putative transposase
MRRSSWWPGINSATFFKWKKRYARHTPSDKKRLSKLEQENVRPKKIAAALSLDKERLQDVIKRKL